MASLVDRYRRLERHNATLRHSLEERGRRVGELEDKILQLNQRRQDVGKRVTDLIAQLDHLDAQLDAQVGALEAPGE